MDFVLPKNNELDRERALRRLAGYLAGLGISKAWSISVDEKKPRRSEQQNRYLWGVCYGELKKVLPGWDAEDIHTYMLGEHFGWETIEGMGRRRIRPLRRSSALNKQEFADFVSFVQRKAADHGCHIPDPNFDQDEAAA